MFYRILHHTSPQCSKQHENLLCMRRNCTIDIFSALSKVRTPSLNFSKTISFVANMLPFLIVKVSTSSFSNNKSRGIKGIQLQPNRINQSAQNVSSSRFTIWFPSQAIVLLTFLLVIWQCIFVNPNSKPGKMSHISERLYQNDVGIAKNNCWAFFRSIYWPHQWYLHKQKGPEIRKKKYIREKFKKKIQVKVAQGDETYQCTIRYSGHTAFQLVS